MPNSPGYDPSLNALFVGAVDWCTTIKSAKVKYVEGELFLGGSIKQDKEGKGWVTSLDADSGKINWQYHADGPVTAAMTPTAGGLLFTGDLAGHFLAFDSKTGQVLVKVNTGGAVAGGIVTYAVKGKQYVATTSGNVSRGTFGALGVPTIIVMSLSAAPNAAPIVVDASVAEPAFSFEHTAPTSKWTRIVNKLRSWFDGVRSSVRNWSLASLGRETKQSASAQAGNPMHGKTLFTLNCAGCHGNDGSGLVGPSLKNLSGRMSFMQAVDIVKNPKSPMPKLYPATLSEQEITDIVAYLHAL